MIGHSEFAPIGNNIPVVNPPPIGGVEHNVQQSTNVPGVQPQGQQQAVEQSNEPNARSLVQKLDAKLSTLLPKQVIARHGNAEALDKMKARHKERRQCFKGF